MVITLANVGLSIVSFASNAMPYRLPLLRSTDAAGHSVPLTTDPECLHSFNLRSDPKDGQRVVNVYDQHGNHRFTFERTHHFTSVWRMLSVPARTEVARVHLGIRDRSVDFRTKPGITHRVLRPQSRLPGLRSRRFYVKDDVYEWNRATKYLERIFNSGGGNEEVRLQVAMARLLRRFRFDYELLVDITAIDLEIALATGFVTMATQWGLGDSLPTTGPTNVASNPKEGPLLPRAMLREQDLRIAPALPGNNAAQEQRIFLIVQKPTEGAGMYFADQWLPWSNILNANPRARWRRDASCHRN
jgi:hypothetical protein